MIYFNYILNIFFNPRSQPVYAIMTRFGVYDCFVNFPAHLTLYIVIITGRRITTITEDTRETTFLFQRFSVALQRGNAVSFHNTMVTE